MRIKHTQPQMIKKRNVKMKIKSLYLIILATLLFSNSSIAQIDTSNYARFMKISDYHSHTDTSSSFLINEMGERIKVDTVKRYYHYSKFNKTYFIYFNDEIYKEMMYYKNRLSSEHFYTQGKNTKCMRYSKKRPYYLLQITYLDMVGKKSTIEYYNKRGILCKELHGEAAKNAPTVVEREYYYWKRLLKGKQQVIRYKSLCK